MDQEGSAQSAAATGASAQARSSRQADGGGAAALRRALMRAPPQPVPDAAPSAFQGGVVVCPICAGCATETAAGLMCHITRVHQGVRLDEAAVTTLRLLERGVCTDPGCVGFRRLGMRQCNRCGQSTSVRPPVEGDIVPGPAGVPAPVPTQAAAATPPNSQVAPSLMQDVELPGGFRARVPRLPPQTLVHTHARRWCRRWGIRTYSLAIPCRGYIFACGLRKARPRRCRAR